MGLSGGAVGLVGRCLEVVRQTPPSQLLLCLIASTLLSILCFYAVLFLVAPVPRPPRPSEKTFRTILPDGSVSEHKQLPCWMDSWTARKALARRQKKILAPSNAIDKPEVFMSVVIPAFNEEERLGGMLEEAVDFLQRQYGDAHGPEVEHKTPSRTTLQRRLTASSSDKPEDFSLPNPAERGWEILVISDGSTDQTVDSALGFARDHQLSEYPVPVPGPRTPKPTRSTHIPHGSIRVISLEQNRGKGGAVIHGMRHVRGRYILFADADGATQFDDLGKLVSGCQAVEDAAGRATAIGSRAHLVGSEAVVKRSKLRNFLMHSFHLLLRFMTPPATSKIKDTQCGFKLFSRASLPDIVPYMHSEAWIFDVEMLMLAESAGISVAEVAVGWKEVMGSKLNVIWDSLGMAWGLFILRSAWTLHVYRKS